MVEKNGMAAFLRLPSYRNFCNKSFSCSGIKIIHSSSAPACFFCSTGMEPSSTTTDGEISNTQKVGIMQSIIKTTSSWEKCWADNVTPWDLGAVTPVVSDLVQKNDLRTGRALVPGCGSGYDVVALASDSRHVTGLDISSTAIEYACKVWAGTKSGFIDFVCLDFFTFETGAPFDLILDYTFFCALEPSMRPLWGSKVAELLASDGELITIMFPMDNFEGGPPYAVSLEAYEKALHPHGLQCTSFQENSLAVGRRKGREFLGRWSKIVTKL